jgi:hypothetical protein
MSAPFDFFERLALRATRTFLIEALGAFGDFVAGSTSCIGDLSVVIFLVEGAVAASLFGSSSSLQRKAKGKKSYTNSKGRRQVKKSIELAKYLRV